MRNREKQSWVVGVGMASLVAVAACGNADGGGDEPVQIAYSSPGDASGWFGAFTLTLRDAAEEKGWPEPIVRHAGNLPPAEKLAQQQADVDELIELQPDVLVFGPIADSEESMEMVRKARDAGIPVMVVNRDAEYPVPETRDDYFSLMHSDFDGFGYDMCSNRIRDVIPTGPVRILRLNGALSASNTRGYISGCDRALEEMDEDIEIIMEINGEFDPANVQNCLDDPEGGAVENCTDDQTEDDWDTGTTLANGADRIQALVDGGMNFVFSMSDMATGAINVLDANGFSAGGLVAEDTPYFVVGADANQPNTDHVRDGLIHGVWTTSPYYGDVVVDTIEKHMAGEEVEPFIPVSDTFLDATNVDDDPSKFPF